MDMVSRLPDSSIDFPPDDIKDTGREVDASAYALAAVFGPIALPPGLPAAFKASIEDRVLGARRAAKESGFLQTAPGELINGKTKAQRDNDGSGASAYVAAVLREEQRQREAWAHTESTVAGIKMTGDAWAQFAERLRTHEELRRRVIEKFEARSMTEAEANAHYDRALDIATIAAKPPSQRTEAEAERFERGQAEPTTGQDLKDMQEMAGKKFKAALAISPATTPDADDGKVVAQQTSNISMVAGPGF